MKIFFPLEVFYPSQAGGTANAVYWLTKNLVKEGFEPVIISSDKGTRPNFPVNRWSENEAGKVMHVRTKSLIFPIGQTFRSLLNLHRADVVHLSSFFYPVCFITAFAARVLKKRIIWSAHGELDTFALTHSRHKKSTILWFIKRFIGRYPLFHSTCDEETAYIHDAFGEEARVVQIPNFIEMPPQVDRSPGNYLLFLGRLHRKKGIENLINALAITDEFRASEYILKIAGKGMPAYEDQLRKLVTDLKLHDKIIFVGQVEGEEKQKLLADAFWTVMPSHTEIFGLVVLESLAQQTPAIASKGSPWEVLATEELGFWTENSPAELSKTFTRILRMDTSEYEAYRKRGRVFVEKNFDIRENIGRWSETYRNLK